MALNFCMQLCWNHKKGVTKIYGQRDIIIKQ